MPRENVLRATGNLNDYVAHIYSKYADLGRSYKYDLNKYIPNTMKVYVKYENSNTKNSTTFSNYIKKVPIEDDVR